ncbi:unnamed protein product [Blepharisma stoltei]|uniref:Calcium-dependent protein kinase n=1 Tax=Blepharisma stoltei TaxID=1481888 RepID=A0AAU9IYR4_9CILI|nr:unnamed protein product [Blepharisma stoltei]
MFSEFILRSFTLFQYKNKEMGCCSNRPDPTSEKGLQESTTKSLKSEIEYKVVAPETSKKRHKNSLKLSKSRRGSFSSAGSSSPRNSKLISLSTNASYSNSPRSPSFKNKGFSFEFLKTPIREKYTTVRKLHFGFSGETSLVVDKITGLKRVIKEVRKLCVPLEIQEMFILEVQKFLSLDHPNIVKLCEVYESGKSWYLVYEHASGMNLLEKLDDEIISSSLACTIIRDILSGLNYCHRNRIVHHGINLSHVIVDSKDGKTNCKLVSFSFPWEIEDSIKLNEVTCYIAPEVLDGNCNELASDVWSVGVLLYSIIQRKPPFRGKTLADLKLQYQKGINFEENNWIFTTNEFKDILSKMFEIDYNKRIDVQNALEHLWVKNNQSLLSTPANNGAINRLVEFSSKDKIARALFSFFKVNLADQNDSRQFIEIFKSLDTNKDGQLTEEELLNETKNLDIKVQKKLRKIISNADLMKKGYIEFSEFVTACTDWNTDENIKKFEKAFRLCDKSGDGQLSLKELKASIKGIRTKEWAQFFGVVDADQSGTISFEELKIFLFGEKITKKPV